MPTDAHGISTPWHPAKGAGGGAALPPRGGSSASGPARASSQGGDHPAQPAGIHACGQQRGRRLGCPAGGGGGCERLGHGESPRPVPAVLRRASNVSLVHAARSSVVGARRPDGARDGRYHVQPRTAARVRRLRRQHRYRARPPIRSSATRREPRWTRLRISPCMCWITIMASSLYPGVAAARHARRLGRPDRPGLRDNGLVFHWNTTGPHGWRTSSPARPRIRAHLPLERRISRSPASNSVTLVGHRHQLAISRRSPTTSGFRRSIAARGSGGSNATWPTSLAPSQELLSAPAFPSDNASVDATSGSLDTEIDLPSYNPNVPALALTYDSVAANPEPIIVVREHLSPRRPCRAKVSAQLTFNGGTPLTTYYYNTSAIASIRATCSRSPSRPPTRRRLPPAGTPTRPRSSTSARPTPRSPTAAAPTLLNYSSNAFGAGWTLQGLEQITSETGGVILDLGDDGRTLWFTSSGSGGRLYRPGR